MCSHARELFQRADLEYTEIKVGDDVTKEEFLEKNPEVTGYPFIVIDRMKYVGIVDVARYLLQKGFITAPRKNERS